jgi:flagellar hook-associated protein 2
MATTSTTSTSGLLSATSISAYKEQIQQYLSDYRKSLETSSLTSLNTKKDTYESQKTVISDLATKLTSLQTTLSLLSSTGSDSIFNTFSSSINTTNFVNPILTGTLSPGNYSIFVKQLAQSDKVMSESIDNTEANFILSGAREFTVKVGSESFNVNFSVEDNESNSSILDKIAQAINNSDAGAKLNASVINDTDGTMKLVFSSKDSGSNNAISFDFDNDAYILGKLGLSSLSEGRTAASGLAGGYVTADINQLNAIVDIDGITITRGSNNISGVIPGLTLELRSVNKEGDTPTNLIISQGKDNVKTLLDKFMEDYNTVVKYINDQVKIVGSNRSIFSGDTTLRSLTLQMRSIVNQFVGSGTSSMSLYSIGIKMNSDGTLAWGDVAKFNKVAEGGGLSNIANLFTNSFNGIASSLTKYLNTYTKASGILYNKSLNIQNQIKNIESRIASTKLRIDKRVDKVTMDYNTLMSNIINLQNQQEMIKQAQNMY